MNKIPRIAYAMNYLNDEFIVNDTAQPTLRKLNYIKKRILPIACCFVIAVVGICVPQLGLIRSEVDGGINVVNNESVININSIDEEIKINYYFYRGENNIVPMSYNEICDYYGFNPVEAIPKQFSEQEHPLGFYKYDDFVDDLGIFSYISKDSTSEIRLAVSKSKECWQINENSQNQKWQSSNVNGTEMNIFQYSCDNEVNYYADFKYNGCHILMSFNNVKEQQMTTILENLIKH